jgi:hypothetical protein
MSEIIETTVYRLGELADVAKERARAWYRETGFDDDWYDTVFDDFQRIAEIIGIRFKTRTVRLVGGATFEAPCIWFSGFWSQGDGACWQGTYAYRKSATAEIRSYAPQDKEIHRIADALQAIQQRNFYQLRAEVGHHGRYCHAFGMDVAVSRDSPVSQDITADAEEIITDALRDLARWLYRQLEQEHDYLSDDEAVDETLLVNGYTFTGEGRRFG